jgi:hypothetical protein
MWTVYNIMLIIRRWRMPKFVMMIPKLSTPGKQVLHTINMHWPLKSFVCPSVVVLLLNLWPLALGVGMKFGFTHHDIIATISARFSPTATVVFMPRKLRTQTDHVAEAASDTTLVTFGKLMIIQLIFHNCTVTQRAWYCGVCILQMLTKPISVNIFPAVGTWNFSMRVCQVSVKLRLGNLHNAVWTFNSGMDVSKVLIKTILRNGFITVWTELNVTNTV